MTKPTWADTVAETLSEAGDPHRHGTDDTGEEFLLVERRHALGLVFHDAWGLTPS